MTVLTKFGLLEKKDQLPLVDETSHNEAKIDLSDVAPEEAARNFIVIRKKSSGEPGGGGGGSQSGYLCCLFVTALLVTSLGVVGGMQMYIQYTRSAPYRFQGWCAIPYDSSDNKLIEPHFRIMTMPHSYFAINSRDVELLDDLPKGEKLFASLPNYLKETFDIGDDFEKIIVSDYRDGRHSNVMHDFSSNVSGIIDSERCFVMPLNPNLVMQPDLFVSNIQGQSNFDYSTVRNAMKAVIPALIDLTNMGDHIERECSDRPTYRLEKQDTIIWKRSADMPSYAKFAQFSGKHIQEIDVVNINELLAYEEKTTDMV